MPELPEPKVRPHPKAWLVNGDDDAQSPCTKSKTPNPKSTIAHYAELQVTSNFTFLTGASHPDELVQQAADLGHAVIAITDVNSLAGIVRAHIAAKEIGLPLIVGCHLQVHAQSKIHSRGWQPAGLDTQTFNDDGVTQEMSAIPRQSRGLMDDHALLSILVYPTDRAAYGRLCRLLTLGKRRAPKGECHLSLHDLLDHHQGLLAVVIPPAKLDQNYLDLLWGLKQTFDDDRLSIAASVTFGPNDRERLRQIAMLAEHTGIPMVATNDVHYHFPGRRALQDVLTCIKHGCTIQQAGFRLFANAERHLKPPDIMAKIFREYPEAIARTMEIAQRTSAFSLDQLKYQYPDEIVPAGSTPMRHLIDLTWKGAAERYPQGIPHKVRALIEHEFKLIDELNYAAYFLTVHDLVVYARSKEILCQGRGAAANSAVCYCLDVTAVDPERIDLLFERFVSKERNEPPDIDIDFEHERREEVIQYIYNKYGRDRAALTAEVISYRGRSAVRDVGKAMGLSLDCVDRLAKSTEWWSSGVAEPQRLREMGLNPDDPTIMRLCDLATEILGFPRHLSQHVGGFVITRGPLCESVPIENAAMEDRTVIEWDKDDIDAMGMLKVDVLGLGMLTCIRKAFELVNKRHQGIEASRHQVFSGVAPGSDALAHDTPAPSRSLEHEIDDIAADVSQLANSIGAFDARRNLVLAALMNPEPANQYAAPRSPALRFGSRLNGTVQFPLQLHTIPPEDPVVYDMICAADTIGVFQIESRAQMSMLPRLRPRCFYDLVIEVAIVRPGPIQGDMVHPYLRRRNGEEKIEYPDEDVERVLRKTLGVPLFQEQAMSLAIVAAGFTPGEADQLRRAIAAWKSRPNQIEQFGERLVTGMLRRGYSREFAERCFKQIQGFSGYGFPESHAASFALLVYVSSWLKCHYPAEFAAALINSQPMGFYAPAQIVRDAQEHGVEVWPIDVNCSAWDCTLEESAAQPPGLPLPQGEGWGEGEACHYSTRASSAKDFDLHQSSPREPNTVVRSSLTPTLPGARRERESSPLCGCLRLGMRLVRSLSQSDAEAIVRSVRERGPFTTIHDLWRASGVRVSVLRRLAAADAFTSMGLDRQHALWQVRALHDESLPIFEQQGQRDRGTEGQREKDTGRQRNQHPFVPLSLGPSVPSLNLPPVPDLRKIAHDYAAAGLSLRPHPLSYIRDRLASLGATPNAELKDASRWPQNKTIAVAGLVLVRQRPSTANGIVFMTLEDETGVANLIVRPDVYTRCRRAARHGVIVLARGKVERQGDVVHVLIHHIEDVPLPNDTLALESRDFH